MAAARHISVLLFLYCSLWSVFMVQCGNKEFRVSIDGDSNCDLLGRTLDDDEEMLISYSGARVLNCNLSIRAEIKLNEHMFDVICIKATSFTVDCGVTVQYLDGAGYFPTDKTYSCNENPPEWCSLGSSATIRIHAPYSSIRSSVHLTAYVEEGKDVNIIEIANKAVIAIGVIIGIVVGVIILGVIIVIIIICCCCKRRGTSGNVYRQPQQAAAMTVVHTPTSQPFPPTQTGYPVQQPGYAPQTAPVNYAIGSQPPPTNYPGYAPQPQEFKVYPPMQNQMISEMPAPDLVNKKGDPTVPPPHDDHPPPYPGN